MNSKTYQLVENYMQSCVADTAHDSEHIYRVLSNALDIAEHQEKVDYDVLICACLLHDIGRKEEIDDPNLCHAKVGAGKAFQFLTENGFGEEFAEKVAQCIRCHRHKDDGTLRSLESKILYDADKLDVSGAIGIARTLMHEGKISEPLYSVDSEGRLIPGEADRAKTFLRHYKTKLEKLYGGFFTERANELAKPRQKAAENFYESLVEELSCSCRKRQNFPFMHEQKIKNNA